MAAAQTGQPSLTKRFLSSVVGTCYIGVVVTGTMGGCRSIHVSLDVLLVSAMATAHCQGWLAPATPPPAPCPLQVGARVRRTCLQPSCCIASCAMGLGPCVGAGAPTQVGFAIGGIPGSVVNLDLSLLRRHDVGLVEQQAGCGLAPSPHPPTWGAGMLCTLGGAAGVCGLVLSASILWALSKRIGGSRPAPEDLGPLWAFAPVVYLVVEY